MLIGNFPIADQVDPEDVILISKDGVHLEQITAELAGLGGTGLRWWKETETQIYRDYNAVSTSVTLTKVLEGTEFETMAYKWKNNDRPSNQDTVFFLEKFLDTAAFFSDNDKHLSIPMDATGESTLYQPALDEDEHNCNPYGTGLFIIEHLTCNASSASVRNHKSQGEPSITVVGIDTYCIHADHLIQNAPGWANGELQVGNSIWHGQYEAGSKPRSGDNGLWCADLYAADSAGPDNHHMQYPYDEGLTNFYELTPMDDQEYTCTQGYDLCPPRIPNAYIGDRSFQAYGTSEDGRDRYAKAYAAFKGMGESGWSYKDGSMASAAAQLSDYISADPADIVAAATDDPSCAVYSLLAHMEVAYNAEPSHPSPWIQTGEHEHTAKLYSFTPYIFSPYGYATEETDPYVVSTSIIGGGVKLERFPLKKVDDYNRNNEMGGGSEPSRYAFYNYWNDDSAYASAYNRGLTGCSSMDVNVSKTILTDNKDYHTGMRWPHVSQAMQAEYKDLGLCIWDITMFPAYKSWFDTTNGAKKICEMGKPLTNHPTLEGYDGYEVGLNDEYFSNGYKGCTYGSTPWKGIYTYDPDHPADPPARYKAKLYAGKNKGNGDINFDKTIGKHWFFDKEFLEEIMEEVISVQEIEWTETWTYEDHDPTHAGDPYPDEVYILEHHELLVQKSFRIKQGYGQTVLDRYRTLMQHHLGFDYYGHLLGLGGTGERKTSTEISVGNHAFWTGFKDFTQGEEEPKVTKMAYIDLQTGAINTESGYCIHEQPLETYFQKKLTEGPGINIDDKGDGTCVITTTVMEEAVKDLGESIHTSRGLSSSYSDQTKEITINLLHEITGGVDDGDYVSLSVNRTEPGENTLRDIIRLDKTKLHIPVIRQGHGVGISSVGDDRYISSTALDKIKVNGQEQSIQVDPTSNDRYVDLTIESGGGGQTVDIYKPIPDYANRSSIITTFSVKNNTYTAPADGVLYLKCRTTSIVFAQVGVTKSGATGETGPVYSLGNGKTGDISDAANMIPMQKGNVAKLLMNPQNISTSESSNGGKFYFIPYVKRDDSETDWVSGDINFTTATASIAGYQMANSNSDTYDSSVNYYTFTPTADGVLMPSNGNPNTGAGKFRIFPMENGEAVDCYYMRSVYNGQAPFEMFPLKKGQTYKFARSSSDVGGNLYFYPFTTKQTDDIYTPFLDWDAAETISLSASTSDWSVMTAPAVTDRPGILIDRINSSNNETLGIMVKTSDGNWELTHNNSTSSKQFIQVPAYDSYNWRYRGASGSVIFVPFKKLVNPGIDFAVENGHNLVSNKTLDLSALYNRIAALEAAVFPTT